MVRPKIHQLQSIGVAVVLIALGFHMGENVLIERGKLVLQLRFR